MVQGWACGVTVHREEEEVWGTHRAGEAGGCAGCLECVLELFCACVQHREGVCVHTCAPEQCRQFGEAPVDP